MTSVDRSRFGFVARVRQSFAFLKDDGFSELRSDSTIVVYEKGDVQVDIYHGRQSYEVGVGITYLTTRYALAEVIRNRDPEASERYRNPTAQTPEDIHGAIQLLSSLVKQFGEESLRGDPLFFSKLDEARSTWSQEYALDTLAAHLRPSADEAFRRRDYSAAADLYGRFRGRLSQAEAKRLAISEQRQAEGDG